MNLFTSLTIAILLVLISTCGSTQGRGTKDCGHGMYHYTSPHYGWSACVPLLTNLVIDSSGGGHLSNVAEIRGFHPVLDFEVQDRYAGNLASWGENGAIGPKPVNPVDTTFIEYGFDANGDTFSITKEDALLVPYFASEERLEIERGALRLEQDGDVSIREFAVEPMVNRNGKQFKVKLVRRIGYDAGRRGFTQLDVQIEHFSVTQSLVLRSFAFRGFIVSSDTSCAMSCMRKHPAMEQYYRMIDSVVW